jgi:hypothetical protein
MASLPKKVFEHFSRGIIHKNEIYVYLFMTFTIVTKEQVKTVETLLNTRPRKCLNYQTPSEVLGSCVALRC